MGVDANLFEAWKRRPPAFLAHLDTGVGSGSAVQVNALHVVTCAHVFGRDDEENFHEEIGPLESVIQRRATVRSGDFVAEGVVVAQHKSLDLALVRLSKARPHIAPPPLLNDSYLGAACAAGVRRAAEQLECLQQVIAIESSTWIGNTPILNKFHYGVREGSSGGGVFAIRDGRLLLVGITHLGGARALMGGAIPSKAVLDFLQKELGFENPAAPADDYEARLLAEGIIPTVEVNVKDYPLRLAFAAIVLEANGPGGTVSFVSRRAIAASEMRIQAPARVLPGHHRLAAWAGRIEQADAAIQALGGAVGLKLRLPTREELLFSWRARASAARAPEGRPLTLADFRANELRMQVPPAGVYEWARDRNGNGYAIEAGVGPGGMQVTPDAQVDATAPCFRAAFDAEGV